MSELQSVTMITFYCDVAFFHPDYTPEISYCLVKWLHSPTKLLSVIIIYTLGHCYDHTPDFIRSPCYFSSMRFHSSTLLLVTDQISFNYVVTIAVCDYIHILCYYLYSRLLIHFSIRNNGQSSCWKNSNRQIL